MTTTPAPDDTWRVTRMTGGSRTHTHPWIAVAPGCPTTRHPTRDCACKVHRTENAAHAYIADQNTKTAS